MEPRETAGIQRWGGGGGARGGKGRARGRGGKGQGGANTVKATL